MADPDFEEILSQDMGDVEAPKPLPAGEYTFSIESYETGRSSQKKTPYVRFFCSPVEAGEDVDVEALETVNDWRNKKLRTTFYLTENSTFRLRRFFEEVLGMPVEGRQIRELVPEALKQQFIGTVTIEATENGEYNPDIDRHAPVE